MNLPPGGDVAAQRWPRPTVRENTLPSFARAAAAGADFVELDTQVTQDGHAVVFHDNLVLTADGDAKPVAELTLAQFRGVGPQPDGSEGRQLLRRGVDGRPGVWKEEVEGPLCTLQEVLEQLDPRVGVNVEVKFNDLQPVGDAEIDRLLRPILATIKESGKSRNIFFSTFFPSAATSLRKLQDDHPVLFLTGGGAYHFEDPRMNSIAAAIEHCVSSGLQGIVSEVATVLQHPEQVGQVQAAGLHLLTYGDQNNDLTAVLSQQSHGVYGVIVDCVERIVEGVQSSPISQSIGANKGSHHEAALQVALKSELQDCFAAVDIAAVAEAQRLAAVEERAQDRANSHVESSKNQCRGRGHGVSHAWHSGQIAAPPALEAFPIAWCLPTPGSRGSCEMSRIMPASRKLLSAGVLKECPRTTVWTRADTTELVLHTCGQEWNR
eukprot:SM000189S04113  [mRNA]  locus=s189:206789:211090:- [translate_table: standard]